MTFRFTHAVLGVLAVLLVSGCGGDDSAGATTQPPTGATTSRTASTDAAAALAPQRSADIAACTLIPRRDISRAFGSAAPRGRGSGAGSATNCEFDGGPDILKVIVTPAAADARRALEEAPISPPQRRVRLPGAVAIARTLIKSGRAGAQTIITLVKGSTMVQILLTDRARRHGSLMSSVIRLGRVAASRA